MSIENKKTTTFIVGHYDKDTFIHDHVHTDLATAFASWQQVCSEVIGAVKVHKVITEVVVARQVDKDYEAQNH